jgi:hypothetical protein
MLGKHLDKILQRVPISEEDQDSILQDVMTPEYRHFILEEVTKNTGKIFLKNLRNLSS